MNPCGKQWYETKEVAVAHMNRMKASPACKKPDRLGVYYCERCEGFHVGNSTTRPWHTLCIGEHK